MEEGVCLWLAQSPQLILHNQPALTKFGRCEQSMVYWNGDEGDQWIYFPGNEAEGE